MVSLRYLGLQVGAKAPTFSTLKNWKLAVEALSPEGFAAIRRICATPEPKKQRLDPRLLSYTFLTCDEFKAMRETCPVAQANALQILCRYDP